MLIRKITFYMKHIFSSILLRQGLAVGLIGLFYSGSFFLAHPPKTQGGKNAASIEQLREGKEEAEVEDDGDRVFADRPDFALEQELELTRDPATGTVPRQRLLAAAHYNEAMLAARAVRRPGCYPMPPGLSVAPRTWPGAYWACW